MLLIRKGIIMAIKRFTLTQIDKYQTVVYAYLTEAEEVKGSVVVLHGMAEHHERYLPFAEFLNSNGYDVFLYDHRGHGTDKKFEDLGHFADNDGYKLVIGDAIALLEYVRTSNRGNRLILFGHSMGSIIARNVLQQYDLMDAAIICGTAYMPPITSRMGMLMAGLIKSVKGAHHYSPFLSNLTTGYKDFAKISDRTAFDWLTRDNNIVGNYINDPYCGYLCTAAFYHDLIELTYLAAKPRRIKKTRKDLPMFIISGAYDPVGGYSEGVRKYFAILQHCGFTDIECSIYDECRHELLNELNKDAVMDDILNWLERKPEEATE